jgi:hypothetical protein
VTDATKSEVGQPASPIAKPNVPTPPGIKVERPQTVRAPNAAGGEVPASRYGGSTK